MATQDLLAQATEAFLEELRADAPPSIEAYAERYPAIASEIRALFPALELVERVGEKELGAPSAHPPAPTRLGDYVLVREIARGGMGVVYEAYQSSLGRRVAVKTLGQHLQQDRKARHRFHREARAAAQLHHTNIVPVYDINEDEGTHYYSMQFIDGQSLDKVWNELRQMRGGAGEPSGPVRILADSLMGSDSAAAHSATADTDATAPATDGSKLDSSSGIHAFLEQEGSTTGVGDRNYFRNVARIALQVVEAVGYAHAQGVIHRDIKPSNIILDTHGRAWVADFGLATDGSDALTETGDLLGTIRYMSPEQFKRRADQRSDIYAIGITIYEFLTLKPAFEESQKARLIDLIRESTVPPVSKIEPNVPHDLETIVLTAISPDPRRRYASAEAFAEDLRRFLDGRPIATRRTTLAERGWLWCQRNPVVATLSGMVVTLLVSIACVSTYAAWSAEGHIQALQTEKARVERAELEGKRRLYDSYLSTARAVRWSNRPGRRFDSLTALKEAAELLPGLELGDEGTERSRIVLRNSALSALALADIKREATFTSQERFAGVAVDAQLERLALSDFQGNVSVRDLATGASICHLPGAGKPAWELVFTPDGAQLIARYEHYSPAVLKIWDLKTKQVVRQFDQVANNSGIGIRSEDNAIAFATRDGRVAVHDIATNAELATTNIRSETPHLRFSPDGRRLAIACRATKQQSAAVVIWEVGTETSSSIEHANDVYQVDWQDERLLTGCDDRHAYVWQLADTQAPVLRMGPFDNQVRSVAFHAAGRLLAVSTFRETTLHDALTGEQLLKTAGRVLRFSEAGQHLALLDGDRVGRSFLATGQERLEIAVEPSQRALDAGADTGLAVTAGSAGVEFCNLVTGRHLARIPGITLAAILDADATTLLTSGKLGVHRWPIERAGTHWRVGPPKQLVAPTGPRGRVDRLPHRSAVLLELKDQAALLNLKTGQLETHTGRHTNLHFVAASPDGRYLASGTWAGEGVKVWSGEDGSLVTELLPDASHARVFFSPDGRYLVVGLSNKLCVFDVPSWTLRTAIPRVGTGNFPGTAAFTATGNVAAMTVQNQRIWLLDTKTWQPMAELEIPRGTIGNLTFTRDGARLIASTTGRVFTWNLRRLGGQLAQLGLNWKLSVPQAPQARFPAPHTVSIALGEYRRKLDAHEFVDQALQLSHDGKTKQMLGALRSAIELDEDNCIAHNLLAWMLLTAEEAPRDAEAALPLARRAVKLNPTATEYWNTLGVACYRNGDAAGAVEALNHSHALDPIGLLLGQNGYFLAMAYHQLGKTEQAEHWFSQAESAARTDALVIGELNRFQAEAREVMRAED